ncbi:MAG: amidase domain-containing protein [Christensenellales bacterium]
MRPNIAANKAAVIRYAAFSIILTILLYLFYGGLNRNEEALPAMQEAEWEAILNDFFDIRNYSVLNQDFNALKTVYVTDEQNGRWAYENEIIRSQYLQDWAEKQGVRFFHIDSTIRIKSIRKVGRGYSFYIIASTEYRYLYGNETDAENKFRLGTYHSLDLIPGSDQSTWVISREWYDDPVSNIFSTDNITEDVTKYMMARPQKDASEISDRRKAAVSYADLYCGAASDGQNGYQYNSMYTNYNSLGGDCANFASQVLYEGGGLKKSAAWNYRDGKGSRAWVNAQSFANYLLYNGRASLIAKGSYIKVYKSAFELKPGDIIAYAKKGKITHISVVTGLDTKGNPLVNCHNADRYRVPWDIGWSNDNIRFYFLSVHY